MPVHGPVHIQVFDLNEPLFYFVPVERELNNHVFVLADTTGELGTTGSMLNKAWIHKSVTRKY